MKKLTSLFALLLMMFAYGGFTFGLVYHIDSGKFPADPGYRDQALEFLTKTYAYVSSWYAEWKFDVPKKTVMASLSLRGMGENPSTLVEDFSMLAVIMENYRKTSHSIYDIKYHLVWITKYRKPILHKEIGTRLRELIRQICTSLDVQILKGHVSRDHVHMMVSVPHI